jgi:predicted NACHT family NTPase
MTIEELEKFLDRDQRSLPRIATARSAIEVVEQTDKLLVLGKPGAGKTTLLKHITLAAIDGKLQHDRIPIFISLKAFSDSKKTLMEFIASQFDVCGMGDDFGEGFIKHMLDKGKCIVLLDGFDEVTSNQESVVREIQAFSDKFSASKYILTCRIAGYSYVFEKFTEVEVSDFTDDDVRTFAKLWFGEKPDAAKLFLDSLFDNANLPIKELASIPLLLTLLCLGFSESLEFQANKAELYKEAIDALLKKWDASRGIMREDVYKNLSIRRKEHLLTEIAATAFEKGEYFVPKRVLEDRIGAFIQHLPETDPKKLEIDCEAVLHSIESQHGLIVERAQGIFSFSHLTFQEYFTARYIVDNQARGTLENLVSNHYFTAQWHEIVLIVSGMLSDAEPYLKHVRQVISRFAFNGNHPIDHLLRDLEKRLLNPYSSPGRSANRALALSAFLEHSEKVSKSVSDRKRTSEFYAARNICNDLVLALALGKKSSKIQNSDWDGRKLEVNRLIDVALLDNLIIRPEEEPTLYLYLYGTKLLLECLNSDCFLPKPTRRLLIESLLAENVPA